MAIYGKRKRFPYGQELKYKHEFEMSVDAVQLHPSCLSMQRNLFCFKLIGNYSLYLYQSTLPSN